MLKLVLFVDQCFHCFFFRSGHGDAVKFLIEYGCSPNLQDHQHSTPLHLAAEKGHIQVVEVLLSYPDTNLVSYHDYQVRVLISYLLLCYLRLLHPYLVSLLKHYSLQLTGTLYV